MTSPLVVVLVVAFGHSDEAATAARTVQEALGTEAIVFLREEPNLDDDHVSRLGQNLHADALVRLTWTLRNASTEAHLHLYATNAKSWTDRDVPFGPDDPPEERGRALGFGIASMVRIEVPALPPPTVEVAVGGPPIVHSPPSSESSFTRVTLDAAFQGAAPFGAEGGSLGASGALGYHFSRPFAVRMAGALRVGEVEPAAATATYLRFGSGIWWTMFETRSRRPLTLGSRVDLFALRLAASRLDGRSTGARWMPATDAVAEVGWAVLPHGTIVGGMGVELTFESTRILVDGRDVAAIAPVRMLGELGIRVGLD